MELLHANSGGNNTHGHNCPTASKENSGLFLTYGLKKKSRRKKEEKKPTRATCPLKPSTIKESEHELSRPTTLTT